jgi:hypothetical protein
VAKLGGFDPDALRTDLGLPDLDAVHIKPAPRWLEWTWRRQVSAITLPWAIYIRRDVLGGESRPLASLLVHELVHVRQWRRFGTFGFLRRYLTEYLTGRRRGLGHTASYLAISLEVEAREVSGA